jgi:hypothetical protein
MAESAGRATGRCWIDTLDRDDAVLDLGAVRETLREMTTIELRLYRRSLLTAPKLPKERIKTRYQTLLNETRAEFRRRFPAGSRGHVIALDVDG